MLFAKRANEIADRSRARRISPVIRGAMTETLEGRTLFAAGTGGPTTTPYEPIPTQELINPVIKVTTVDPNASEAGNNSGKVRFTRTLGSSKAVTLSYTLTGSAANGSDYKSKSGSVSLAKGQAYADVLIEPKADNAIEGSETVTLTLNASPNYARYSDHKTGTVSIADTDVAAPTGLTATIDVTHQTSGIKLAWNDASSNETAFEIQRSANASFSSPTTKTVDDGDEAYAFANLDDDKTYYFRVRAVGGTEDSAWSNVAQAKTVKQIAPIKVNAGGGPTSGFGADAFYAGGSNLTIGVAIDGTSLDSLYNSVRHGSSFGYDFDVPDGAYEVRLHFAEIQYGSVGQREFDVKAEGATLLNDYDLVAAANGSSGHAIMRAFNVNSTGGQLNLDFIGQTGNAVVSAIEVTQKP